MKLRSYVEADITLLRILRNGCLKVIIRLFGIVNDMNQFDLLMIPSQK